MACLWGLYGIAVGLATLPKHPDAVGVVASILAGVIVLVPCGAFLGASGGDFALAAWGGLWGAGLGICTAAVSGATSSVQLAPVGLIGGAFAGATLPMASARARSLARFAAGLTQPR